MAKIPALERLHVLWLNAAIAARARQFPADLTKDPADRKIVAGARADGLRLATKDRSL